MENGTMKMSTPVFGYKLVDGELILNPDEAKIVKQIFEWYLNGYGSAKIAQILNEMNIEKRGRPCHWTPATIKKMLTNEKYIGDQLFQKKYTTDTLPFRQVVNKGEKNQYYYSERHEPIVSRETFDKVQKLLSEHNKTFKGVRQAHIFARKIYCGKCGASYKSKHSNNKNYWVCRNHNDLADNCSIKQISEYKFYDAFVSLCSKLRHNYKQILLPCQSALQDLKLKKFSGNANVMEIHMEIAKLREQTHVLSRLKTKGFLDEAKYLEQTTELTAKIYKLQSELKKITRSDDEDEMLEHIDMLKDFFEKREKPITEFEESAFESIVENIIVINQNELEFHMIGGFKFKEKI